MGVYEDLRPEVELDVPDGLQNEALVTYLHKTYHGLFYDKPEIEVCTSCGGTASIGTGGEKIVKGMHPSCRRSESFKKNNL